MSMRRLTCLLACVLATAAHGARYEAEGIASLGAGRSAARELALDDARRQIAVQQGGRYAGQSESASGVLAESSMLSAPPVQGTVRVVGEREADGLLYLRVVVDDEPASVAPAVVPAAAPASAAPACAGTALPEGRFLRRRALATFFPLDVPRDAAGLGEISTWLPAELARRLSMRDVASVEDGSRYTLFAGQTASPLAGRAAARGFAERSGAQFVLAGRIVDTAVVRQAPRFSLFGAPGTTAGAADYTGPFAGLVGGSLKVAPTARRFALDVWLYDGLTGALLMDERFEGEARGDVAPSSARAFTPWQLDNSDYGRMVSVVLDRAVGRVALNIGCLPFTARVARAEGGQVVVDAGAVDGLKAGDRLMVYRPQPASEVRDAAGRDIGMSEVLVGDLMLSQVQPRLAIGVMRGGAAQTGDLLRFPRR